jgi:hypothetical protein
MAGFHHWQQSRDQKARKENIMSSKPSHIAYVVTNPKDGSDKKAVWHRVGAIFPHKNGNGFDLVTPEGVSLTGRIVCTEYKDKEAEDQYEAAVQAQIREMSVQRGKFDK